MNSLLVKLSDQHTRVTKRLIKNSIAEQVKMELEIELSKARSRENKTLYKKIKKLY